jgi:hypothetical protein
MSTTPSSFSDARYLAFVANLLEICRANLLLCKIPEDDYKKSERGKTLRVRGRWINAKFEPGPWSDWFEYIIN